MTVRIITGDNRVTLPTLEAGSVQTCVTSPPYYGLRDYGTGAWEGGDADCTHAKVTDAKAAVVSSTLGGGKESTGHQQEGFKGKCGRCGAARVDRQIGMEETPDEYVASLVDVFREVRRVLRDDGTVWLNLGDSYASTGGAHGGRVDNQRGVGAKRAHIEGAGDQVARRAMRPGNVEKNEGASNRVGVLTADVPAKNLLGMPWRVAFALQADGWYLRSDIIWHKPNPMPESVTDRPTKAHEYLFLLTKSERYYYDAAAIAEQVAESTARIHGSDAVQKRAGDWKSQQTGNGHSGLENGPGRNLVSRNRRSVWTVATQPYKGAHFATMPRDLVEPCILAGSARQACETCGAAWVRDIEKSRTFESGSGKSGNAIAGKNVPDNGGETKDVRRGPTVRTTTLGFSPGCKCEINTGAARSLVLDPFGGAGTTGLVAEGLGRDAVLCELNPSYAEMGRERINGPLFSAQQ